MKLLDPDNLEQTEIVEPEKVPQRSANRTNQITSLVKRHPIPVVLLAVAMWCGALGNMALAAGIGWGGVLYIIGQVVDTAADELLGEADE